VRSYTNVLFNRYETQLLDKAALHLGVAFPRVHESVPRLKSERIVDHEARVVLHLVRDTTQATHANIVKALAVVRHLESVLALEAELDYWLDTAAAGGRPRPEFSEEPTSPYHQCVVLADTRAGQLVDARRARRVLRRAAAMASPLPDRDSDEHCEDYDTDSETAAAG
jgi:hypothetical protein